MYIHVIFMYIHEFIIILEPTKMIESAPSEMILQPNTFLILPCKGKTDPSTPLITEWRVNDTKFSPDPPHTRLLNANSLVIDTNMVDDDDIQNYLGELDLLHDKTQMIK